MSHMSTWDIPKLKIFKATIIFSSRWHYFCFLFNPLYMWFILFYICIYSIYYFIYVYICMYILCTYIILYMLYNYMHIYRQQLFRSLWAHQYSSDQKKILKDQRAQTTAIIYIKSGLLENWNLVGTLLYACYDFNIYFSKIFVTHIFGGNLVS